MKKIETKKLFEMSFANIKDSDKVSMIVLFVLVICFIMGYYVLVPSVASYKENKVSIENSKKSKDDIFLKETLLKDLGSKLETEKSFIERGKDVLPTDSQVPEILVTLDKLATSNSLYINTFSPNTDTANKQAPGEKKVAWKTVDLQFDIVGTYPNIKNFIKELEDNVRTIDIVSISINSGGELTSSDSILRFHIGANAYYQ